MPKILLFESGTTGWSGSFKSCYYLALALKKINYTVTVGCFNESDYWPKLENEKIRIVRFDHKFYSQKTEKRYFSGPTVFKTPFIF